MLQKKFIHVFMNLVTFHAFTCAPCSLFYITLHYITLHYITLHYIILYCIMLYYIILYYIILYYIILYYIILYYIILYYIILYCVICFIPFYYDMHMLYYFISSFRCCYAIFTIIENIANVTCNHEIMDLSFLQTYNSIPLFSSIR